MKRIILIGQGASGKTFLAFNIAAAFDNVAYINGRDLKKQDHLFRYSSLNTETDLLIIDDVFLNKLDLLQDIIYFDSLRIEKQSKAAVIINLPTVIITIDTTEDEMLKDEHFNSMEHRCKFIVTSIEESERGKLFTHRLLKK